MVRRELQDVIEQLAHPELRSITAAAPGLGFVQPDRVKLSLPLGYGIATEEASTVKRLKVEAYHEANPPPAGVLLGSIEIEFVVAAK